MSKKNAVMLILLGGTFMSFVGLYMRLLTDANGFQILFYRSLSLCAIVGLVSWRNRGPCQLFAPPHWTGPVFTALGSSRFQNGLGAGTGFYLLCLRHALYQRCLNSVYPLGHALYGGDNRLGLD